AEVRRERRERVVGNLGTRGRNTRDERGLARIGEPDQADVGEQLQLEPQEFLFSRLPRLYFPWRPVGRRGKPCVAKPPAPAARDEHALRSEERRVGKECR